MLYVYRSESYVIDAAFEIPREQFLRSILVANVTRMSLKRHEEIRRVAPVGRGCCTRMLATFSQQIARVGLVEFVERHDTRTNKLQYTACSRPPAD